MSVPVFRTSEKCFVLRFLGSPSVSFDQVRMLSHERSCGECFFVESFFRHSVNRLFLPSLVGAKIVVLGVGSRFVRSNGQRSFVVFCLHVCFVAFECCGVCYRASFVVVGCEIGSVVGC